MGAGNTGAGAMTPRTSTSGRRAPRTVNAGNAKDSGCRDTKDTGTEGGRAPGTVGAKVGGLQASSTTGGSWGLPPGFVLERDDPETLGSSVWM